MIETKYALRYNFPHALVHIVDNSGYQGELPVVEADDPSLFASLVVTATPMGEDSKVVKITRSDVAGTAFGLNYISNADRQKYGQAIDYPLSLLDQGAPVQLLRVTPEDATYAFTTMLVDYYWDDEDADEPLLHIRFRKESSVPAGAILSNFKTRERLAQAIINDSSKRHDPTNTTTDKWHTRVFAVIVSAGRGSVYNNMAFSIDMTNQSKHPANVRYVFNTTDKSRGVVVESFAASLVNKDNANRLDFVETVNNTVGQRVVGSSIVVPFINEDAVSEIFEFYKKKYKDQLDTGRWIGDEFVTNTYKTLNVNTFDVLYGRYIYDGNIDQNLPFLQIDAVNNDIPRLDAQHQIKVEVSSEAGYKNEYIQSALLNKCYGLYNAGDTVYVGDVYLSASGSKMSNPRLSVVTAINQYTGAVTSVTFSKVYPLSGVFAVDKTAAPLPISKVYASINELQADSANIPNNTVVAAKSDTGFTLHCKTSGGNIYQYQISRDSGAITGNMILEAIDYSEMANSGLGNVLGTYAHTKDSSDQDVYTYNGDACSRVGYVVIDTSDSSGKVYINKYNVSETSGNVDITTTNRQTLNYCSYKFGTVPTKAGISTTTVVGESFDVMGYNDEDVSKWSILKITPTSTAKGTGYAVGDIITCTELNNITCYVTAVGTDGAVESLSVPSGYVTTKAEVTGSATSSTTGTGLTVDVDADDYKLIDVKPEAVPDSIDRFNITGVIGSIFKIQNAGLPIPDDYYSAQYGDPFSLEDGGYSLENGYTGFFDDDDPNSIVFKYRYAARLVQAFKGEIDKRILSPTRTPAKFLFDAGYNTIVGSTFVANVDDNVPDVIAGSTMYSDDEKDQILFHPEILKGLVYGDVDVKQAMYDLMIQRVYDGIDESRRPIGPGSGLSLHLDSCITDGATALLINKSFARRFTNPNASWDIGGYKTPSGATYTYVKRIVDNLFRHCQTYSINKPFVGRYSAIQQNEYVEFYPDIDTVDWDERELFYMSGGNAWIPDSYGVIKRQSQRTFKQDDLTSDLIQENNMRTLSQLTYLLKNKIEGSLMEYSDDSVLKTLKDECNNMFSNWVGNLVQSLDIDFKRDTNIDGGDIVVCTCNVVFRGLIMRVPIIVNVNRRQS